VSVLAIAISAGRGAHGPGHRRPERVVVGEPGTVPLEPGVDPEARPAVELGLDDRSGRTRLETQRLAGEVGREPAVRPVRDEEVVAQRGQRVGGVSGCCVSIRGLRGGVGPSASPRSRDAEGSGRSRLAALSSFRFGITRVRRDR
jgi:hypothetical protein